MALQHRILHRLLVSKHYVPEPDDWNDENNTVQVVTENMVTLKGHFAYHFSLDGASVDSMLGHAGSIPDSVLVEYGVDHEDLNELALYIDNLAAYTEDTDPVAEDSGTEEVDLNELLKDD